MYCVSCGAEVPETAVFCTVCGKPFLQEEPPTPKQMSGVAKTTAGQTKQPAASMTPASATRSASPGTTQQSPKPVSAHTRGCFGTAIDDIMGSSSWLGKILLLALIMVVPILNFVTVGYIYRWGVAAARGDAGSMPSKIVSGENFKTGFFVLVFGLIGAIIVYLVVFLVMLLGAGGGDGLVTLLLLLLLVFAIPFAVFFDLALFRVALFDSIGRGFNVNEILMAQSKKKGTAYLLVFVPAILMGIASVVLASLENALLAAQLSVDMSVIASVGTAGVLEYALDTSDVALLAILAIGWVLSIATSCLSYTWTNRGLGHYVHRFVPEWVEQADAAASAKFVPPTTPPAAAVNPYGAATSAASSAPAGKAGEGFGVPASAPTPTSTPVSAPAAPSPAAVPMPASGPVAGAPFGAASKPADPPRDPYGDATNAASKAPRMADTAVGSARTPSPAAHVVGQAVRSADATESTPDMPVPPAPKPEEPSRQVEPSASDGGTERANTLNPFAQGETAESVIVSAAGPAVIGAHAEEDSVTRLAPLEAFDKPADPEPAVEESGFWLERADGRKIPVPTFPASIGRGSDADIDIPDCEYLSRVHAKVTMIDGAYFIEDLGSTNRTMIRGVRMTPYIPAAVFDGDVIRFGTEEFTIHIKNG